MCSQRLAGVRVRPAELAHDRAPGLSRREPPGVGPEGFCRDAFTVSVAVTVAGLLSRLRGPLRGATLATHGVVIGLAAAAAPLVAFAF